MPYDSKEITKAVEELELKALLGEAIKSELEAQKIYEDLEAKSRSFMVKERFKFLAEEEKKHEAFLRDVYRSTFNEEPEIPETTRVPLPEVKYDERSPLSELIEMAMDSELAARDFYLSLSEKAEREGKEKLAKGLKFLANMEEGHYHLLRTELEAAQNFDEFDSYWEMIHVGP